MREKELRIALVVQGGVSLAIYMHGVTKELWKLLRASRAVADGAEVVGDTEQHWAAYLRSMRPRLDMRVVTDIVAGASAGGINGVLLAHAVAGGHDMERLRDLWLARADIDVLLDPEARPSGPLAKIYARPLAWYAAGRSGLDEADPVRGEVLGKLSSFMRGRWFEPPLSGTGMVRLLDDALTAMEAGEPGPALVPPTQPLDLFVTATDLRGQPQQLMLNSPPYVVEGEHRRLLSFSVDTCDADGRRTLGERGALLFAARATSSFPGAFPPATIAEVDTVLAERAAGWPGRALFVESELGGDAGAHLIDGSVLNNRPFGPAIVALRSRAAHRDVDRRFVYVDPNPGVRGFREEDSARQPGWFTTILRALADIPRAQPIRDDLERIAAISRRARRLRAVADGMAPAVDAAIARAVGPRFFVVPLSPARMENARGRIHSLAAREAGFAYAAYGHLKLRTVLDDAAGLLAASIGADASTLSKLRGTLRAAARERGAFAPENAAGPAASDSAFVRLLRGLDIGFRVRRLRFVLRRLTMMAAADPGEHAAADDHKRDLHAALSPFLALRRPSPALANLARMALAGGAADALDGLAALWDLGTLDRAGDAAVVAVGGLYTGSISRPTRQAVARAWLGYPFYDIALLPLMDADGDLSDSFDELKVDRISPDDARSLSSGGALETLRGWQLNAFGAFFSRAWRENDYLWGRLHAAERLADIVASASEGVGDDPVALKTTLFAAILAEERAHLRTAGALIDRLEARLTERA